MLGLGLALLLLVFSLVFGLGFVSGKEMRENHWNFFFFFRSNRDEGGGIVRMAGVGIQEDIPEYSK